MHKLTVLAPMTTALLALAPRARAVDVSPDVLAYGPAADSWTMVYDGSALHPDSQPGADVMAVPEPGAGALFAVGLAALGALGLRRRSSTEALF
jgi:hypothetical protein